MLQIRQRDKQALQVIVPLAIGIFGRGEVGYLMAIVFYAVYLAYQLPLKVADAVYIVLFGKE
jgi:uncharacterized protein with PQ loop repeat